jgi:chromosome segregation ATPase
MENERLKEEIRVLLTETTGLRIQANSQIQLQSQVSQLQEDLARVRAESQAAEATQQSIRMDHSQQLNDMSLENQRLQVALTKAQSEHHDAGTGLNELMVKYHQLEADLDQSRLVCKQQEIALAEVQKMKDLALENERLRYELDRSQKELQEQRVSIASDASQRQISMGLDGGFQTAEQLSQEAEGLRRQLKGQRQEMKELQDLVKRSDVEKRDLISRIEQLEHALADAEKHR